VTWLYIFALTILFSDKINSMAFQGLPLPKQVCNPPALDARPPALRPRARHQGVAILSHRSRFVVSRSTGPPLSPSPHANSCVIGPAVINTHTHTHTPHLYPRFLFTHKAQSTLHLLPVPGLPQLHTISVRLASFPAPCQAPGLPPPLHRQPQQL
jgi:hypothetical protein